jgi:hypothetical protein
LPLPLRSQLALNGLGKTVAVLELRATSTWAWLIAPTPVLLIPRIPDRVVDDFLDFLDRGARALRCRNDGLNELQNGYQDG